MKWALTADTQFDQKLSQGTILPSGFSSRLQDSIDCFEWIVSTAHQRQCDALFVLGDVLDNRKSVDLPVLHAVADAFSAASDVLDLYLLVGNHDCELRTPSIHSLRSFQGICAVIDEPTIVEQFACVPWVDDEDVFRKLVRVVANKGASYLLSHCMVAGAVPQAYGRSITDLCPKAWKKIWLGDVHEPVFVEPNIQYCGAPMQWHYGDAGGSRGFWIFDDETGESEFVENTESPRFWIIDDETGSSKSVGPIGSRDFVRVKTSFAPQKMADAALKHTPNVEVTFVELESDEPRIDLSVSDEHEDALRRYCKFRQIDDETLIQMGVEILDQVS